MVRSRVPLIFVILAAPTSLIHAGQREDCARCHRAQALPQPSTSMGRALETGAASEILIAHPNLTFRQGVYSYQIVRDGDRSLYKVTDGHETVTVTIDWAFGLGAAGQTYVYQRSGRWYESRVSFQPYRLTNSKCYDSTDARIRCVACHDPHREVEQRPAFYDSRCQACHTTQMSPAIPSARRVVVCPVAKKDCVTCHMPKIELPGSHNLFSDHRIRIVRQGEPYPE